MLLKIAGHNPVLVISRVGDKLRWHNFHEAIDMDTGHINHVNFCTIKLHDCSEVGVKPLSREHPTRAFWAEALGAAGAAGC